MPGISGGTLALVTGVYETIITSASHVVSGLRALFTDRARAREEFASANWAVIIPLLLGLVPALLLAAWLLAPLVEDHPVPMWALFLGMTATAIIVPLTMKGTRWRSEEHTSELQSRGHLVCRLLLEKKKGKWSDQRLQRDR